MRRTWWTGAVCGAAAGSVLLASAGALLAQGPAAGGGIGRVASIDVIKVFNEYQRQKDLTEELRSEQGKLQAENEQRRARIDSLQATLDAMSEADPTRTQKMREYFQEQIDYKNWYDLMQAELSREVAVWTIRVYKEILEGTAELAKKQGVDLVLYTDEYKPVSYDPEAIRQQIRERKVVYAGSTIDMTQPVLDTLNSRYRAQPRQPMLQVFTPLTPGGATGGGPKTQNKP